MKIMNKHKRHFLMVSGILQDGLEHRIVGDEGTTEPRVVFPIFKKVPKGKHLNLYSAAKSWNLKRSTRGDRGESFGRRSHLHTAAFEAAMVKLRQG